MTESGSKAGAERADNQPRRQILEPFRCNFLVTSTKTKKTKWLLNCQREKGEGRTRKERRRGEEEGREARKAEPYKFMGLVALGLTKPCKIYRVCGLGSHQLSKNV